MHPPINFTNPVGIANLRAGKWASVPSKPGAYRWYFPAECLEFLGISSHCDLKRLNLHRSDDGTVGLYFGVASSISQRLKWHASQPLRLSALKSGFLSTYRFSLLALTGTDYLHGEELINKFIDGLSIAWVVTASKEVAEQIERDELASTYHYPINIRGNSKPEVARYVQHLKNLRLSYRSRYLEEQT